MPFYNYYCSVCKKTMLINHRMGETATQCLDCESQNSLVRIYDGQYSVTEKKDKEPGHVVHSYIKDVKETLEEQKKELIKRKMDEK